MNSSSQLEEYLGTREPEKGDSRQKTLQGFNTEYNFHGQAPFKSQAKHQYSSSKRRVFEDARSKNNKSKVKSTKQSVKKVRIRSERKKMWVGTNDSHLKQSKWVKKSNAKSQYENWKKMKRSGREVQHVRKHSEQLFSTLKDNVHFKPSQSRRKIPFKDNLKNRKKLSIDISKNGVGYSHLQYKG